MEKLKTKFCACLFAVFALVMVCLSGGRISSAYADAAYSYSDVLEDLEKDSSFSADNYPEKPDDYSLQVIQLAESENKELFVYVYQPSGENKDFTASSINISTTVNDEISYYNYELEKLSSDGTLYKYLVKDFTVKSETTRYYAISSIYRPFDETIDEQASGGNTVTEVNYEVAKQYCFSIINGKPYVSVVDIETITVTDKFVGFVRYSDGFKLYVGACDSHFVAFNTDKNIDNLLEADVYYTSQGYSWSYTAFIGASENFGDKQDNYAYLKYTDKVEHTGDGLFAGTYTWDRIETVEDFIEENDLTQDVYSGAVIDVNVANVITDEGKEALQNKKWVLRFAETSYSLNSFSETGYTSTSSTLVGDVTILRLKFETDGITYNLGTIDNKQSGSDTSINEEKTEIEVNDTGKTFLWLLGLLALILLLVLLAPVLPHIINAVLWVVLLPFRIIKKLFHKKE